MGLTRELQHVGDHQTTATSRQAQPTQEAVTLTTEDYITSEVSKRGWRTEGVGGRKPIDSGLFLDPFSYAPLMSRRKQFWGTIFAVFWALWVANPLPPTPVRNL